MVPFMRAGAYLFLPQRSAREIQYDGPGLLEDPAAKAKAGFTDVLAVGDLDEFLARLAGRGAGKLYVRLSPRDTLDDARSETALMDGRRARSHYNDQLSVDQYRIEKLHQRYPQMEFRGHRPGDRRPAGDQDAGGDRDPAAERRASRPRPSGRPCWRRGPGVFEYEIEAAAMAVILKGGAKGAAYAPIVGSGPNSCIFHYEKNSRRVERGDVVLMDFGADLDHLAMDITRTWPASGTFTTSRERSIGSSSRSRRPASRPTSPARRRRTSATTSPRS